MINQKTEREKEQCCHHSPGILLSQHWNPVIPILLKETMRLKEVIFLANKQ